MTKFFKLETRHREDWAVIIYTIPDHSSFYVECVSSTGEILSTEVYDKMKFTIKKVLLGSQVTNS